MNINTKSEKLFDILGLVDEKLIDEAQDNMLHKFYSKNVWIKRVAIVACVLITIGCVTWYGAYFDLNQERLLGVGGSSADGTYEKLPMLDIDTDGFYSGSMGYEGYMANDISELSNQNPWSEDAKIKTLPVYQNPRSYDKDGRAQKPNIEKMKRVLFDVARRLKVDLGNVQIKDDYPDEDTIKKVTEKYASTGDKVPMEFFGTSMIFIEDKEMKIKVDSNLATTIEFISAITLPQKYNFTHYSSYAEIMEVSKYLKNEYKDIIHMENPEINIYGGDYSVGEGEAWREWTISFFDKSGGIEQEMLNYNFSKTEFYCNDEGKLFLARIYKTDLSQKLGDYPIISPQKAKEMLSENKYITTVPEEFPGKKYIKKIELIYRGGREQTYLPYYRIYVDMPTMKNTYGAYYIPAVEEEYIANMQLWDGSFN